ncbi:MAG: hypothetical protein WDN45_05990 [Caulobacteraceae bacterium]
MIRRAIRANHTDIDRIERLDTESADRLDDLDSAILARPTDEIVALICRDLGLEVDEALDQARPPPPAGRWPRGPEGAFRRR